MIFNQTGASREQIIQTCDIEITSSTVTAYNFSSHTPSARYFVVYPGMEEGESPLLMFMWFLFDSDGSLIVYGLNDADALMSYIGSNICDEGRDSYGYATFDIGANDSYYDYGWAFDGYDGVFENCVVIETHVSG